MSENMNYCLGLMKGENVSTTYARSSWSVVTRGFKGLLTNNLLPHILFSF